MLPLHRSLRLGDSSACRFSSPRLSATSLGHVVATRQQRATCVRTRAGTDDKQLPTEFLAPVQPTTSSGEMLREFLFAKPELFRHAAEEQLQGLLRDKEAREAAGAGSAIEAVKSSDPSEVVLYKRMGELRRAEARGTLEDVMYVSILDKFVACKASMMPRLHGLMMKGGREEIAALSEGVHGDEALEAVQEHLVSLLGPVAASAAMVDNVVIKMSKFQMVQLYASSVMFGYFLRRAHARFQLEKAMGTLPLTQEDAVEHLKRTFAMDVETNDDGLVDILAAFDVDELLSRGEPSNSSDAAPSRNESGGQASGADIAAVLDSGSSGASSGEGSTDGSGGNSTSGAGSTADSGEGSTGGSSGSSGVEENGAAASSRGAGGGEGSTTQEGSEGDSAASTSSRLEALKLQALNEVIDALKKRQSSPLPVMSSKRRTPQQLKDAAAFKLYIEQFDEAIVAEMTRLLTVESAALLRRQINALLGDARALGRQMAEAVGTDATSMDEVMQRVSQAVERDQIETVTMNIATQQRTILEAVAYGSFLRDVESHIQLNYAGLLTPMPFPKKPPGGFGGLFGGDGSGGGGGGRGGRGRGRGGPGVRVGGDKLTL